MNQVDDAIGEVGGEVRAVIGAAILAQAAGHVDARKALGQGQLYVGISLIVAQQNIEARFLLLDEVILKGERLFIVGDGYVIDVDGFADQRPCFRVFPAPLVEIGGDPRAQVLGLTDVNNLAFGVLVQVHAGRGGEAADFLGEIHRATVYDRALEVKDSGDGEAEESRSKIHE